MNADIFGFIASGFNIVMLMPQVVRTWKTKKTKDLSLTTLIIFLLSASLWVVYGVMKQALPVIISNVSVGITSLLLIGFKLKYK